jgi:2-phospho-L-lactate guanylyltransferase
MWVIIPLKVFSQAKQRLSGFLMPGERVAIFKAMVEDLLNVVGQHPDLAGVVLVSDDNDVADLAIKYSLELMTEKELGVGGLNEVVQAATAKLARRGIDDVMVIHGDMPLLTKHEISRLVALHNQALRPAVTIAQDSAGLGTNCMLCSPASLMSFQYGTNSLQKHQLHAINIGAQLQTIDLPGAGCDIDTPDDLIELVNSPALSCANFTNSYLEDSGIASYVKSLFSEQSAYLDQRFTFNVSNQLEDLS